MTGILALDLGTTSIKAGYFAEDGRLERLRHGPSPPLTARGGFRESDPEAYIDMARELVLELKAPRATPLSISTQRSSFVLWHRKSGKPETPLISWQDLRAEEWCRANRDTVDWSRTGLPLSAHYAGPKLAFLLEKDRSLKSLARGGELLFGTLDTFLLWHWTRGACHEVDLSVAARTLLVELGQEDWSTETLTALDIPVQMLPAIRTCRGFRRETSLGYPVAATIADQAAGALPLFSRFRDHAYINAGTGTFVMRLQSGAAPRGYVTAMLGETPLDRHTYLWEGAINAGARLFDAMPEKAVLHPAIDPEQELVAIPDDAGLGAPFWRADLSGYLSPEILTMASEKRRAILFKVFLFRIRQVVEGLFPDKFPSKIAVTGGLAARDDLMRALASFLPNTTLFTVELSELGLFGAARLASDQAFQYSFPVRPVEADPCVPSLEAEYGMWKNWLNHLAS